jgi:hypothetical protein
MSSRVMTVSARFAVAVCRLAAAVDRSTVACGRPTTTAVAALTAVALTDGISLVLLFFVVLCMVVRRTTF